MKGRRHATLIPQDYTIELNLSNAIFMYTSVEKGDHNLMVNMSMQLHIRQIFANAWVEKFVEHIEKDIHACVVGNFGRVQDWDYTVDELGLSTEDERNVLRAQVKGHEDDDDFDGYKRTCQNVYKKIAGRIFECEGKHFKAVRRNNRIFLERVKA